MVWARMQSQWKGKNYCLSFSEEAEKIKLRVVFKCIFGRDFLSPHTAIVSGIENYPAPACLVALMIRHRAKIFEVSGLRTYQSENKFLPLFAAEVDGQRS